MDAWTKRKFEFKTISHDIQEYPIHPKEATVWYVFWDGDVIGPYFFKYGIGQSTYSN